jgi:hypothetical protein
VVEGKNFLEESVGRSQDGKVGGTDWAVRDVGTFSIPILPDVCLTSERGIWCIAFNQITKKKDRVPGTLQKEVSFKTRDIQSHCPHQRQPLNIVH